MNGGGAILSSDLVNALAELNCFVTVLVPDVQWDGKKFEPKINPRVKVVRVQIPSRSNLKLAARRCKGNLEQKGMELSSQSKFDFVFSIFHPFHRVPAAAVSCAKKLGISSIVKIDDAVYEKTRGIKSIQRRIENAYNAKTLQNATKILVPNKKFLEIVRKQYKISENKITIIPNGVDPNLFNLRTTTRKNHVVFSGMMYYHRGLEVLLEAVPKVVKNIPDAKFILLGEGPEIKKLQKLANERKITSNVDFRGWVDRGTIPKYLNEAAIGIGPLKHTEVTSGALPIKVLEYMSASLPIIAKKGTLPDDVLKDNENGFFVDGIGDLAEKITQILTDIELAKKMGARSYDMVQKFSWNKIANQILELYNEL